MKIIIKDDENRVLVEHSFKYEDIIQAVWNALAALGIQITKLEMRLPTGGNWVGVHGTNG